jgi:hypothetical protein
VDLNTQPDQMHQSWIIDFNDMDATTAATFEAPFRRVKELVLPARATNNRKAVRERWWQFAEKRPGLRRALISLDECIALRQSSDTLMPILINANQVIDQTIVVFASDSRALLAVLSSSPHLYWALKYGLRTMAGVARYTPSTVFDTFPLPALSQQLDGIGTAMERERHLAMNQRSCGLTELYRLVDDSATTTQSDIARLRAIHVELDEAVMKEYGWIDIPLDHGFHSYRGRQRWTVSPAARTAILGRLLEENHRRAAEEASEATPAAKSRKPLPPSIEEKMLFS